MLPVGRKPVVQYVVEELLAAGIEQILFITGRKKRQSKITLTLIRNLGPFLTAQEVVERRVRVLLMECQVFFIRDKGIPPGWQTPLGLDEILPPVSR